MKLVIWLKWKEFTDWDINDYAGGNFWDYDPLRKMATMHIPHDYGQNVYCAIISLLVEVVLVV